MKRVITAVLAAGLLLGATGCATQAPTPEPTQTVSNQEKRYTNCIEGVTENYRIKYGEAHYRNNVTEISREIKNYCTEANRK